MKGNMGFGIRPDGSSILPVYDMMNDDPRRHGLYLDKRARQFLLEFDRLTDTYTPFSVVMTEAGLYDGLGTLLPLGAYWYDLVHASSVNMFSLGRCFDMFSVEQLTGKGGSFCCDINVYKRLVQLHRYEDSMLAFETYVEQRKSPKYNKRKYTPPEYMYVLREGKVVQHAVSGMSLSVGLDPAKWTPYESPEPVVRYWYHSGSDVIFVTQPEEEITENMVLECDELDYEQYCSIKARMEKGEGEEDLSIDGEFDPFDII